MSKKLGIIEGIEFINVEIQFDEVVEHGAVDLGSIQLQLGKRGFMLDVISSEWYDEEGTEPTTIIGKLCVGIDGCTLEELPCNFDLTASDLQDKNLIAEIFISGEEDFDDPISIELNYMENGEMKSITLKLE